MPQLPGRNTAWAKLVNNPAASDSPNQVRLTLRRGFLDPLSLMTFKVLPQQYQGKALRRADDEIFAKNPTGSGPFEYHGRMGQGQASQALFIANPFYQRAGKPGQPHIREVRMVVSADPGRDFMGGKLQLLLDLPTSRIKELIQAGFKEQDIRTLSSRRVYFLAVNHDNEALQDQDLRKAIAHAIDRETLLKDHFRAGYEGVGRDNRLTTQLGIDTVPLHPMLNGPYPAGSWACAPASRVPPRLYAYDLARTRAKLALSRLHKVELTLKYPDDDPRVAKACTALCAQVAKLDGIKIKPVGLPPREFREVIFKRKYDLAYCYYDYDSEAYWLWPLFDPDQNARNPGGPNFLRYQNDDVLEKLFRLAMSHQSFPEVKKLTQEIHAHLHEKMPLIPLWQLHAHIAVHPDLKTSSLDPLRIFANVEEWRLERK
jgi:ABC-type transport system substrate-binding protein